MAASQARILAGTLGLLVLTLAGRKTAAVRKDLKQPGGGERLAQLP